MTRCLTLTVHSSKLTMHPELMRYWDYERNTKDPSELSTSSRVSVHWRCPDDSNHRWMALVKNMAVDCKCPGCTAGADRIAPAKKPAPEMSLAVISKDVASEWYAPYNGCITPDDISGHSHLRFWWKCSAHGVIWESAIYDRVEGKGCPVCKSEKISKSRSTLKAGDSLAEKYPELTTEWNILLNDITPDKVFAHGRDLAHWVCSNPSCRHQWSTYVYNRTCNGSGCPKCGTASAAEKERVPLPGHSLLDRYPTIASELVMSEHGESDPSRIAYSSGSICTWSCSVCEEVVWEASVNSRTAKRTDDPGCPKCGKKRGGRRNAKPRNGIYLKDGADDIAREWDEKRNREELGLELDGIALHSNLDAYWICPKCGESYLMTINKRTSRGDGCTVCNCHAKSSFPEKAILYYIQKAYQDAIGNASPDIDGLGRKEFDVWIPSISTAVEYDGFVWHLDEERDITKERICFFNGVKLIRVRETRCPVYQSLLSTTVINRNSNGGFSSLDAAIVELFNKLNCTDAPDVDTMRDEGRIRKEMHLDFVRKSLAEVRPDVASQWDYDGNGDLTPWMFRPYSTVKVSWLCPNGNDPYVQRIRDRTRRGEMCSCEVCVRERMSLPKRPKPGESLQDVYPEIADEWCDDMNDGLSPSDLTPHSTQLVYWTCPNHEEPYLMRVSHRTAPQRSGCPFCSTPARRVLPGFNDLATRHPELVDEWDDEANGDRTPYNTLPGSHYMAHWICRKHDDEVRWVASVHSRSRGCGCPACKGRKISESKMRAKEGMSLQDLHENIAKCLSKDDNAGRQPSEINPLSEKEYVWICQRCGDKLTEKVCALTKAGRVLCSGCRKIVGRISRGVPRTRPGRSLGDVDAVLDEFLTSDKNGGLTAHDLSMTSKMSIDWKCPRCGEEWTTSPDLMRKRKRKCKKCGYGSSS